MHTPIYDSVVKDIGYRPKDRYAFIFESELDAMKRMSFIRLYYLSLVKEPAHPDWRILKVSDLS